ncbi:FxLD family lanthipeptide [Lentzea sp. NPDC004782]|uniref:FxLD family lanthipeptide n=1 Tax=Lentzea sp. NPDC004782 TaxID=3154458 RepID=UPI0033AA0696
MSMTVQADLAMPPAPDGFDLDIRFAESGPVLDVLVQLTGDNCGTTCESACVSCP